MKKSDFLAGTNLKKAEFEHEPITEEEEIEPKSLANGNRRLVMEENDEAYLMMEIQLNTKQYVYNILYVQYVFF